jgi:hypothetical protein
MAVTTANTAYSDEDWHSVASGEGEFQIEASADVEYALAGSTPADSLIGHRLKALEKFAPDLPAAINVYVRKTDLGLGGAYFVIVTPGQ